MTPQGRNWLKGQGIALARLLIVVGVFLVTNAFVFGGRVTEYRNIVCQNEKDIAALKALRVMDKEELHALREMLVEVKTDVRWLREKQEKRP